MEKEIESFADHEYELQEINGRMTLQLRGEEGKLKRIEADKIPKLYEAMREGWDVDVQYAVIDGSIDLHEAGLETDDQGKYIITGIVYFIGASFNQGADFMKASFTQDASFMKASFNQYADFIEASFTQYAHFIGASFNQVTYFTEASFNQYADFSGASFNQGADFIGASFNQYANFSGASFNQYADFDGAKLIFPGNFAEVVILENTVWRGIWNYIARPLLLPIVWLFTFKTRDLPSATVTKVSAINTNTMMDASTNPRLKRYIDDEQWIKSWRRNPKGRYWREPVFRLWELTSHCGRSIGLWAFWSVLFAVAFALIYNAFGADSITFSVDIGQGPNFRRYLYYSVVTFTTLGFGDIIPKTDWARLAVGAEVVLGYVMLGGLVSIFANKFARRS